LPKIQAHFGIYFETAVSINNFMQHQTGVRMKRLSIAVLATAIVALTVSTLISGCTKLKPEPKTAKEFVEMLSNAYKNGDAETIVMLTVNADSVADSLRLKEAENDLKSRGFGYVAWTHTKYKSEREDGNHIHVDVEVANVPTSIVLVLEQGVLKIHPYPSTFE
jgi:hypothetical protein